MAKNLQEILSKSKKLTAMAGSPDFDKYVKNLRDNGGIEYNNDNTPLVNENIIKEHKENRNITPIEQNDIAQYKMTNLPKAILESITSNPIDASGMEGGSVLDTIEKPEFMEKAHKQIIKNERAPMPKLSEQLNQNKTVNNSSVDYSLIKLIVEDTIKKYAGAITKKILTENKNNLVSEENNITTLRIGDKFQFLTENGDLYVAKLKFIKNIKD